MFKFAANKLAGSSSSGHTNSNTAATSTAATTTSTTTTPSKQHHQHHQNAASDAPPMLTMSSDATSRRRCQIQKDLFAYNKIADKGFPTKPSAMDYDRKLKLLAIGTRTGEIRVYGEPNSVYQQLSCYQDAHPFPIVRILFVQGQHQLITVSERTQRNDATNRNETHLFLVLWHIPNLSQVEYNSTTTNLGSNLVEKVKEYQVEPKIVANTRLSALALLNDNSHLFIGFESGDVYVFNVGSFQMVPGVINKDYILKNLPAPTNPELKKLTALGSVESICHHPRLLTKLLIAYQRGLWIIFDFIKNQIEQINQTQQQLESAVFYQHGECVATSHTDGSFILWDLSSATPIQSTSSTTATSTSPTSGEQTPTAATSSHHPTTCSSSSAPNIFYGPFPCKAVNKCMVKTCRSDQPYVIFSGGCPRVNYSDKITITVIQGEQSHVCFDFTSKIIEFFTVDKPTVEKTSSSSSGGGGSSGSSTIVYDNPQALFVLLEEEFVAIDLVSEQWPQYKLPYLCSVHSSAILCTHYASGVTRAFYDRLVKYGSQSALLEPGEIYSEREWPIASSNGNSHVVAASASDKHDLLLTGHEDGSVRFWDVTGMSMTLIYKIKTSDYFQTDTTPVPGSDLDNGGATEENWPPFRKVGTFDPFSDDPKLGIQKIHLCPRRELIAIAGTAGQVLLMSLADQPCELPYSQIKPHKLNITSSAPEIENQFVWKGHEPLLTRGRNDEKTAPIGSMTQPAGYQLQTLIQIYPPASVTALALNTDWQLIGAGTSQGFVLFDYNLGRELLLKCTLDPASLEAGAAGNAASSSTMSRRKSLKKSLRESFRKLRRGRSQKAPANKKPTDPAIAARQLAQINNDEEMNEAAMHRPIERQVEAREFKCDDVHQAVVRYIYFVRTNITSNHHQANTMWVGTNMGIIYIYALQFLINTASVSAPKPNVPTPIPTAGKPGLPSANTSSGTLRTNQTINCLLLKEMRLKHRAPVVHIQVIDQNMQPLPIDPSNQENSLAPATAPSDSGHKLIICSEEQFKVFQLPTLKPVCKFKLTAVEGARVRRIGYTSYVSRADPRYHEYCLSCLSNLGDISVYSLPALKRQVQIQCMKQSDINAITSFVFSKQGQAFYLQSASEFVHISMSARDSPHLIQQGIKQLQLNAVSPNKDQAKQTPSGTKKPVEKPATTTTAPPTTETPTAQTIAEVKTTTSSSTPLKSAPTTTTTTTATTNNEQTTAISSPKSPPPPVPAPRTILAKEETNNVAPIPNRTTTSTTETTTTPSTNSPLTKPDVETKPVEVVNQVDVEKEKPADETTKDVEKSVDQVDEKIVELDASSPIKPITNGAVKPVVVQRSGGGVEVNNTSDLNASIVTTNGMGSLTSTSTLAAHNGLSSSHAVNCSISTGQSDSSMFNVSSSGYNGSSTCNTFNLSIDSVVDKFSDEFSQLMTQKKLNPSSIDEDEDASVPQTKSTNGVLNESNNSQQSAKTNGHSKTATTNGQNGHHYHNGNGNGHTNNGANFGDDETNGVVDGLVVAPQKASSPLSKQNGQNGHHNHHSIPLNIEQVTKRIENGNKLEYRETAID